MQEKQITLPITKLSYSSFVQLLRNPMIFKMKEILGIYDTKMGVSGMIGQACHEALKFYYGGNKDRPVSSDRAEAIAEARGIGLEYLTNYSDEWINYGKTGNREQMLKGYTQALDFYFGEEPTFDEILICEERLEGELKTDDGQILPLPAVGKPDIVHRRKDGGIEIVDFKFVSSFTSYDEEDGIKIIQAMFMYHLLLAAKGLKADRMIFREIKRSKNADFSPQIRDWAIPFDHEPYKVIFYNLYRDVVKYLSNDPIFLPNLSDMFDGDQAWTIYSQGLISADMSDVEVMHKVREVAFTSKKFVPSRLDSELNKHLLPEEKIKLRLAEFGIPVEPVETIEGAQMTQYRFKVSAGIRMSTIKKHQDDIARALEAKGNVNIVAPIPGTSLIGIEVDAATRTAAKLAAHHLKADSLQIPIGQDVSGAIIYTDLRDMPHLLIAGATGAGKSVLLHTILNALTRQAKPEDLELLLIDPKRVELGAFNRKPHLREKVIYEQEAALRALLGLTDEMDRRYKLLEKTGKRDLGEFNDSKRDASKRLPYIVAVIDEFADFMLKGKIEEGKRAHKAYSTRSKPWLIREITKRLGEDIAEKYAGESKARLGELLEEDDLKDELNRGDANVETLIVRLAQLGRAAGIHLIIATQRPSVDVITGLIKANFPTRIALTTSSPTDSIIILGTPGAEKLAGKGDMIYMHPGNRGNLRLQGLIS